MNTLERIQAFEELIQYSEREQQFLGTGKTTFFMKNNRKGKWEVRCLLAYGLMLQR